MAFSEIAEVRKLTDSELTEQISGTRRELFDLRFQRATSRL
jgi:large subunit ribosomal protein L29